MASQQENDRGLGSYVPGDLESPFLEGELFVREAEPEWEAHLAALEAESPFQSAFEQDPSRFDAWEMEEPESLDEELSSEGETGIIDGDNRVRVKKTAGVPWRWICKVSIFDDRHRYHSGGTGVLISSRHVLTAAHVVYPEYIDPYNHSIEITPALNEGDAPFGTYSVSAKPKIPKNYDPKAKDHLDWDYALITLKERVGEEPFPTLGGEPLCYWGHPSCGADSFFARLDPQTLNGRAAYTAGYPSRKGGEQLWCAAGILHSVDERRRKMWMTADTTKGQSGSPVWVREQERYYLVGVAAGAGEHSNSVVRVTRELIRQVRTWISEDGDTPTVEVRELSESAEIERREAETFGPDREAGDAVAARRSPRRSVVGPADELDGDALEVKVEGESAEYEDEWDGEEPYQEASPVAFADTRDTGTSDFQEPEAMVLPEVWESEMLESLDEEEETDVESEFDIESEVEADVGAARATFTDFVAEELLAEPEALESQLTPFVPCVLRALAIDVDRAVRRNRYHAKDKGWGKRWAEIERFLGFGAKPSEKEFARRVADWQCKKSLEPVDGIIGKDTWKLMQSELRAANIAACRAENKDDLDFEFDLNYGMEATAPPTSSRANEIPDDEKLTTHKRSVDGFKVIQDGNRMEISTQRFGLTTVCRDDLQNTMDNILNFVSELESECRKATPVSVPRPDDSIAKSSKPLGKARYFSAGFTLVPGRPIFPLGIKTYFRTSCGVSAAPQATMDIPLKAVDELVAVIKKSEGKPPGVGLTGPKGYRAGVRSDALFFARSKVNRSRDRHIANRTQLSDGTIVSSANFTTDLQGFMILLVSYLRTSEIRYGSKDWEGFAKAYPPIVTHTHFRDMFHRILSPSERKVFNELYGDPAVRDNLYALAGRSTGGATRHLFPTRVQAKQDQFFTRRLTWHDLVQMTIDDTPLIADNPDPHGLAKALGVFGTESMFTPLAKASNGPVKAGPIVARVDGVKLELRRIGFNWVPAKRWPRMVNTIYELCRRLNGETS